MFNHGKRPAVSTFIDSAPTRNWVSKFELNDVPAALMLLRTLELVSFEQFEAGIITLVEALCENTRGRIAMFSVDPNPALLAKARTRTESRINKLRTFTQTATTEKQIEALQAELASFTGRASSAGRINHCLLQQVRRFPKRLTINPSVTRMRAERCKHIALVDDIVGSGTGLTNFWRAWASKSMKSWLSYGYCTLWCLVYCAHQQGLEFAIRNIPPLRRERVLTHRILNATRFPWDEETKNLCRKYGRRTGKSHASLGYSDVMSPIIFQHGCPNDCPALLWDSTGPDWDGLFPNRSIPTSLFPYFNVSTREERHAESLWRSGQYGIALSILESLRTNRLAPDLADLLAMMGLLVKGCKREDLQSTLLLESSRVSSLIEAAGDLGLTDYNGVPTEFGRDLLTRSRQKFAPVEPAKIRLATESRFYYPSQLRVPNENSSS